MKKYIKSLILVLSSMMLFGCQGDSKDKRVRPVTTEMKGSAVGTESAFEGGGDHAGNGGFAFEKSEILLQDAAKSLEIKILNSTHFDLENYPERRVILSEVLQYDNIIKSPNSFDKYRGDKLLALDYTSGEDGNSVLLYGPFFERFSGVLNSQLAEAQYEVEMLLLHEASHIWGYNDVSARKFALEFLEEASDFQDYTYGSTDNYATSPLAIEPVSQYACISRSGSIANSYGDVQYSYDMFVRMHYMFPESMRPTSAPISEKFMVCHNRTDANDFDSVLKKRLFEKENHIKLWKTQDIEVRKSHLLQSAPLVVSLLENSFSKLSWSTSPFDNFEQSIGYVMKTFINSKGETYCLNENNINAEDDTSKLLFKLSGNTEALYAATSKNLIDSETPIDISLSEAPTDTILIKESQLKKIWFYIDYKNGGHKVLGDDTSIKDNTMMFYWPISGGNPLDNAGFGKLYVVKKYNNDSQSYKAGCIPR